ncbi:hypothetical protein CN918_27855 [Priestia megaterium]|nr:hypothetical protein CN918_27855 [Priestia megaterium]
MKWFWLMTLWVAETVTGLVRNFWGNMTAILLTVACLTLFSISFVTGLNAKYFAEVLDDKIEIRADIKDNETDYESIAKNLVSIDGVNDVRFISKEKAFEMMEKEMKDNVEVLHAVGENPFPARYVIKVDNPDTIDKVVSEIKELKVTDDIQYGKEYVQKLVSFTNGIQNVGYIMTFAAAIFTVYIVTNVIKYNIDKRNDELKIKRLTGAGMFTIRLPFVLEALIITFASNVIVYELFTWGYGKIETMIKGMISYAPLLSKTQVLDELYLPLLLIALGIGFVGSFISTQRFIAKY